MLSGGIDSQCNLFISVCSFAASLGDELTNFTDLSVLKDDYPSTSASGGGKKRKATKGGNKKHGKKRRFR